jgi:hypothetical protein
MIEHELETLLRLRFPKISDDTWGVMVGEHGPFTTLDQKIIASFAFKIIDEATKDNLKIIKNIRNAFAHAKKLFPFEHDLVRAELKKMKVPNFRKKHHREILKAVVLSPKAAFVSLCLATTFQLIRKGKYYWQGKSRRLTKRQQKSPFAMSFLESADLQTESTKPIPVSSLPSQSGDPNSPIQTGLLSGILPGMRSGVMGGLLGLGEEARRKTDKKK